MRRLQVNLSALVEVSAQHLSEASMAISAKVALGEQVAEWLDPYTIAALAQMGLTMDLATGNLRRGDGGQVQALGMSVSRPERLA